MITPALYEIVGECPWCGESLELTIDCSAGEQCYVEDCHICCAPIVVGVAFDDYAGGEPLVSLRRENE